MTSVMNSLGAGIFNVYIVFSVNSLRLNDEPKYFFKAHSNIEYVISQRQLK